MWIRTSRCPVSAPVRRVNFPLDFRVRFWPTTIMTSALPVSELDVSGLLRPGVYTLSVHGTVAYIGTASCLLTAIATHRSLLAPGHNLPSFFPLPRVPFDAVSIIACSTDRMTAIAQALIAHHNPAANRRTTTPRHSRPLPTHGAAHGQPLRR